jgi:hypothetical protein
MQGNCNEGVGVELEQGLWYTLVQANTIPRREQKKKKVTGTKRTKKQIRV